MMQEEVQGMIHPLHRSVTKDIMVMGIPYSLFYALWTSCAVIVLSLGQFWYIVIAFSVHFLCVLLHKKDEDLFYVAHAVFFQADVLYD